MASTEGGTRDREEESRKMRGVRSWSFPGHTWEKVTHQGQQRTKDGQVESLEEERASGGHEGSVDLG